MSSEKLDVENLVKTTFRGTDLYMPPSYKDLYQSMGYEKQSIDLFERFLKPNSVFVDVGTHVGFFTVLAAKKIGPDGKVYSFEPIPENIAALKKNIALNKLNNVEIINHAVSSRSGDQVFKIRKDTGLSGFYDHPLGETIREIKVKTSTLDEHFKNKKIDFIKIDTEGNELKVLKGAKKTLKNNPDAKIILELNPGSLANAGTRPEELIRYIVALGYEVYSIDDDLLKVYRITNKHHDWQTNFPSYGYANLLCIPRKSTSSILFFSHANDLYGAERALTETASALLEQDIIVTVVKPPGGGLAELLDEENIPYIDAPIVWWGQPESKNKMKTSKENLKDNAFISGQYIDIINSLDYQFVATNSIVQPWPAVSAKLTGKSHLWFLHEFPESFDFIFPHFQIMHYISENSEKIFLASGALEKELSKYIDSNKLEIIYQPVTLKKNDSGRTYFKRPNALRILSVGSISTNKRQLDAIKAVHKLSNSIPNIELIIVGSVGDIAYMKIIKGYLKEHKLQNNVSILPQQKDIYQLYSQADVILVTSEKEGFGRTVVEGMLASKVVVASKSGGPEELIISDKNGYLYSPGDIDDLTKILFRLAHNKPMRNGINRVAKEAISDILAKNGVGKLAEFLKNHTQNSNKIPITETVFASIAMCSKMLKENIDRRSQEIENIQEELQISHIQNQKLMNEYTQLMATLNKITASKSWKVTKPLRLGLKAVKGGKNIKKE